MTDTNTPRGSETPQKCVWRVWDADSVGGDRGRTRLIWGCGVRHEGVFVSHEKIRT